MGKYGRHAIIRLNYREAYKLTMKQGEAFIEDKLEDDVLTDVIKTKLCKRFSITEEKADEYIYDVISKKSM